MSTAVCPHCVKPFSPKRRWQLYCSDKCRKGAFDVKVAALPGDRPPLRQALTHAIEIMQSEATRRRMSINGSWQPLELEIEVLREHLEGQP